MMSKRTANVIEAMNAYKGEVKTQRDWAILLDDRITFETFRKYALEQVIVRTEANLNEIVALLNDCAGNDCYDCDWLYEVIDNKVYKVDTCYKMV